MSHDGKDQLDLSDKTTDCDFSSIIVSLIKFTGSHPFGYSTGQNGADNQAGITNVPLVKVLVAC